MNKRSVLVLGALAASLALAGCGGGSGTTSSPSPAASSPAVSGDMYGSGSSSPAATASPTSSGGQELKTATVGGKSIVVDEKGMVVYYYTRDNKDATVSACTGGCIALWPPVVSNGTPKTEGVTATVGSIKTPEGQNHVTLNGMPIYYYAKDTGPGQATGQDVAGVWYVVAPDGTMITDPLK